MLHNYQFDSPIGPLGIKWESENGKIRRVMLPGDDCGENGSVTGNNGGHANGLPRWLDSVVGEFEKYFAGSEASFFLDYLDYENFTPFQLKVHHYVFTIPHGETRTYSQVAHDVNSYGAARAVGNVMASNPYPIIIPCHRIVTRGGGLGGYRGGLNTKKFLLELEHVSPSLSVG